jgi:RNA polymerase sigma factor (sigma-70 family)
MVRRRCRRLLGDDLEAYDAMQDVFVQVIKRKEKLSFDTPSSLLFKIATDISLNRLRTRRRHPETPDDKLLGYIASSEDLDQVTEHRSLLERIFEREQVSTRTMAVLHYVDRMTLEEVAQAVGLSVSGVRKRLRALRAHARQLEEVSP